jgi:hypothetical protein
MMGKERSTKNTVPEIPKSVLQKLSEVRTDDFLVNLAMHLFMSIAFGTGIENITSPVR